MRAKTSAFLSPSETYLKTKNECKTVKGSAEVLVLRSCNKCRGSAHKHCKNNCGVLIVSDDTPATPVFCGTVVELQELQNHSEKLWRSDRF